MLVTRDVTGQQLLGTPGAQLALGIWEKAGKAENSPSGLRKPREGRHPQARGQPGRQGAFHCHRPVRRSLSPEKQVLGSVGTSVPGPPQQDAGTYSSCAHRDGCPGLSKLRWGRRASRVRVGLCWAASCEAVTWFLPLCHPDRPGSAVGQAQGGLRREGMGVLSLLPSLAAAGVGEPAPWGQCGGWPDTWVVAPGYLGSSPTPAPAG